MSTPRKMVTIKNISLITCIVQKGVADEIVKAATEAGAQGATIFYARGMGVREKLGLLGVAIDVEKEVLNIVVANEQVDMIFERIFLAGKMDTPGMGFIYVTPLIKAATYIPPEILEKLDQKEKE